MSDRVRTTDVVVASYNLVMFAVWASNGGVSPYAPWIAVAHGAAAALPLALVLRAGAPASSQCLRVLREVYPLLWLLLFWSELGLLHEGIRAGVNDAAVAAWDLELFGRHLNLHWMPAMPQPLFSELMHFSYVVYYPIIFLPPIIAGLTGRTEAFRDMTLRLMVTYLGCYLVYLAFPVVGPTEVFPLFDGALTDGFFYRITHAAKAAGNSIGTAFPSSHVAGAVTSAIIVSRWFPRPVAALVTVQAAGVFFATVYTQQHYPIDSVAGLLAALSLQLVVVPALTNAGEAAVTRPVPVLPAPAYVWAEPVTGGGR